MAEQKAKVKVAAAKVKKKTWVQINAPKSFNSMFLGETTVADKEKVIGKSISVNLMILTDDPRKQAYTVRFDVTGVKDGKADTQVVGISMMPSAIKRLIRRNRDKVDDSFTLRTAGGRTVRVKPTLITKTPASNSAQTAIRLHVRKRLTELYRRMRFDDIVLDLIDMKTQRLLRDECSKIHPVRSADIRELVIVPNDRAMSPEMTALAEKEVADEEARRAQIASAAAAASVDTEESPVVAKPKRARKKAEETMEDAADPGV